MAFSSLVRKATNFLGFGGEDSLKPPPLDGEIIYCKNNVCVHPPAPLTLDSEHHPGYLSLRSQHDEINGPTLILTWVPNSTLKKNPRSIENSPNRSYVATPRTSPRRRQEFAKSDNPNTPSPSISTRGSIVSTCSDNYEQYYLDQVYDRQRKKHSMDTNSEISVGSKEDNQSVDDFSQGDDVTRKLSSSNRSQTDSGIGNDDLIQNNEKLFPSISKVNRVGVNVNDLHGEKNKNNQEMRNAASCVIEEESSSSTDIDGLTAEEQLAAMLNRNKLHAKVRERTDSNKSVSIEMEGDNLIVVTEELEDEVIVDQEQLIKDRNTNKNESKFDSSSSNSIDFEAGSLSSDSTHPSPTGDHYNAMVMDLQNDLKPSVNCGPVESATNVMANEQTNKQAPKPPHDLGLNLTGQKQNQNDSLTTPDISVTRWRTLSSSSTSSSTTSGPDSSPPSPCSSVPNSPLWATAESPSSCESVSISHNLTFPHNTVTYSSVKRERKSPRDQVCGVFSVDLGQMRSLRLFYSDPECTRGQVVIASPESQYKILHFHHGGLDKLADIFQEWNLFAQAHERAHEIERPYKQFLIVKPQLTDDQCHPEEGVYITVTDEVWKHHMTEEGIVEDDYQLRKSIFFGGLEPTLRHEAWPFLLHYYPFDSTFDEREDIRNDKYIEYQNIRAMREAMTDDEKEKFWRNIQCTVEKDVVRTDRSHPYFRGEDNPNIEVLKNILLNYAVANPQMGYTQGMSDLLAPVLAEIQHEADAYWCFVGLMQRTIFVSSPKDSDMDKQLNYLREIIHLMQPTFYSHIKKLGEDAMELLFCHRWILLCFKREFPEADALRIWEACWAHYQTDYFHLFICVSIVSVYSDDVIEQNLPADEILLHFSSLAMHMNGELVLRKARGLLHEFRKMPTIRCTLHGLCSQCDPGMWDSNHVPKVKCVGHPNGEMCPYSSQPNTPNHQ
ncbi:hypothetical protein ScPMuIL_004859 [Solemya velum]